MGIVTIQAIRPYGAMLEPIFFNGLGYSFMAAVTQLVPRTSQVKLVIGCMWVVAGHAVSICCRLVDTLRLGRQYAIVTRNTYFICAKGCQFPVTRGMRIVAA